MSQNQNNKNQKKLFSNFIENSIQNHSKSQINSYNNQMIQQLQLQSDLSSPKDQEESKNQNIISIKKDTYDEDESLRFNQNLTNSNKKYNNNNTLNYKNKTSKQLQQKQQRSKYVKTSKQQKKQLKASKQTWFNTMRSPQQRLQQTLDQNRNMFASDQSLIPISSIMRPPSIVKSQSITSSNPMIPQINLQQNSQLNKSCQDIKLTFANNLHKLVFKYTGGHANALYNYHLKIKNQTECKVIIKIKCTNPNHYQVRPSTTILDFQQIVSFSIELKLNPNDLSSTTLKHDLSRYKDDKFKIIYSQQDQNEHHHMYNDGEKILPVFIQQTVQDRLAFANNSSLHTLDTLLFNKQNQKLKQSRQSQLRHSISELDKRTLQQKQIQVYKKLIQSNHHKINHTQLKVKTIQKLSVENWNYLFSKQVFLFIGTLGLAIGWYIT